MTEPPARAPRPQPVGPAEWALPEPTTADRDGLLGFGADLAPETLVAAYRSGIFPWPHDGLPLPWFSPDPRAVLDADSLRVSRSLGRFLRRCAWQTTVDADFAGVVDSCAARPGAEGTWITPAMRNAYVELNHRGWAHSVEVWDGHQLVGGIYGVRIGGCFTGESMFHRSTNASKVALVALVRRWTEAGGAFIDVQLPTAHLESMGARALPRRTFLARLAAVRDDVVCMPTERRPVSVLV